MKLSKKRRRREDCRHIRKFKTQAKNWKRDKFVHGSKHYDEFIKTPDFVQNDFEPHHFNDSSSRLGNMVEDDAPLTLDDEPNTPRASSPPPFFTDLPPSTQDDVWRFMLARKTDTGIANDFAEAFHLSLPQSQDFV